MIEQSTITCPKCGHQTMEHMPMDACQFFYDCKGCGERLKPLPGDCCVFCSFGTVPCPRCSGTSAPSVRQSIMVKVGNPVAVIEAEADTGFAPATRAVRRDVFNK